MWEDVNEWGFLVSYLHNRLCLHAYKVQIVQSLKPDDKPCRFRFAQDVLALIDDDENYLHK